MTYARPAGFLGLPGEPPVHSLLPRGADGAPGALFDIDAVPPGEPLGLHLLVGLYNEPVPSRRSEIDRCLASNLAHPDVERVHVFDETGGALALPYHPKMRVVPASERVTFGRLFGYANRELSGRPVAVANSDIFFDESLARLRGYPLEGRFLALTRWDESADGSSRMWTNPGSQDVWVFLAPLPEFPADWYLGKLCCDNRLAYEADRAGLLVTNPARDLRTRHLHLSDVRRYSWSDAVPGPRMEVPIGSL